MNNEEDACSKEDGEYFSKALDTALININAAISLNDASTRGLGSSTYIRDGAVQYKCKADEEELKLIHF